MKSLAKSFAMLFVVMFASLALLSCFSPTSPKPDKADTVLPGPYTGPAGTGGVSFSFNVSGTNVSRALTDISGIVDGTFVTVQLYSEAQKTTLFDSETVSLGSANISFSGLIPGMWNAFARIYETSNADAALLYWGSAQARVIDGVNTEITLPVYDPGSISIAVTAGIYADAVSVVDQEGYSSATYPIGREYQLLVNLTSIDGMPDQQVYWTTSDPRIVTVDQNGLVQTLALGEATITATAVIGGISNTYTITVAEDYVGTWLMTYFDSYNGITYTVLDIGPATYTKYEWSEYGSSNNEWGTIIKSGSDSFIQTAVQAFNFNLGYYTGLESVPYQMFYELDPDGGIIFDPRNSPLTYQKLNSVISVDSITIDPTTFSQFATGITTGIYYLLNTTYVPATPTVPVTSYSILRPEWDGLAWNYSGVYTDVTGSSGSIYNDEIYFYYIEPLYPVTYKLRIRSLSNPDVMVDIPILVTGSN